MSERLRVSEHLHVSAVGHGSMAVSVRHSADGADRMMMLVRHLLGLRCLLCLQQTEADSVGGL